MSARRFPLLATPGAPLACFHCAEDLASQPAKDCDYADGEGRYRKLCPICGCRTYYDVTPSQETPTP